jgi:hypothetical protein
MLLFATYGIPEQHGCTELLCPLCANGEHFQSGSTLN